MRKRLHVLVMPEAFPTGPRDPAGVFSKDYIAAIAPYCDVTVLMLRRGVRRGVGRCLRDGIEYVTWTPFTKGRFGRLEGLARLGTLAGRVRGVDLVHAHGPIFYGFAGTRVARALGIPIILTVHTGPFSKLLRRRSTRVLTKRSLEAADCVCTVSDDLERQIRSSGIRPRRVVVSYNPVDTDLFRPSASPGQLHKQMVFAGRLEPYKGAFRVLQAFNAIAGQWPGWRLTIAGEGPERAAIERFLAANTAIADRVLLLGAYARSELARLLASADCFVYPSERETFGIVLAEAMSAGLPVIGPDRTAPPEFIDRRSGLLVPPNDVDAIARAMHELLSSLSSYRSDEIRSRVVERFGLEAFGKRMVSLYNEVCEQGSLG